jgi:phage-related protein
MVWLIDDLKDLGLSIAEYISQAIYTLVNCILYPIQLLFYWISKIIKLIFDTFITFFETLWNTFNITYSFISDTLMSLFPNIWTTIILLGISIIFLLRLYYFIRGS